MSENFSTRVRSWLEQRLGNDSSNNGHLLFVCPVTSIYSLQQYSSSMYVKRFLLQKFPWVRDELGGRVVSLERKEEAGNTLAQGLLLTLHSKITPSGAWGLNLPCVMSILSSNILILACM